ncbi:MAG: microtubule integrity protein mal3 [Ramalina farinacea]|uniref:Microtubule integrity protein mal3 n=1 Tax=Ramalina farinacea TaxID=258253 RepID=A0AA43QK38_9LECA|nr:microtubule integrity protein mal3 [Ramalina farinacea]
MSRVKFNVNTEYAYLQNFKILQNAFTKHGIERAVPIESLIKCKMQDNLEFLQWTKRYWDQYYPGGDYDALARRKGAGAPTAPPPSATPAARTSTGGAGAGARRGTTPNSTAARPGGRIGGSGGGGGGGGAASAAVANENNQLKQTVEGLERERDFYFSKLRDIELLIQQAVENDPQVEGEEGGLVKMIQQILYSTEEGFEIPAEAEGGAVDDGETF